MLQKDAGPDNNLLSNMIPAGIGKNGSIFTPIVEFYNPNAIPAPKWTNEPGATFLLPHKIPPIGV